MEGFRFLFQARNLCKLGLVFMLASSGAAFAQAKSKQSEVYMYEGADREQRLLEGARKEGTVTIYTSLNLKDSAPITEAFEKKYGIKVSLWRAGGEKVVQRALTEARAGRFTPDVFESDGIEIEILAREKMLAEFKSPVFKELPAGGLSAASAIRRRPFQFFHDRLQHQPGEAGRGS